MMKGKIFKMKITPTAKWVQDTAETTEYGMEAAAHSKIDLSHMQWNWKDCWNHFIPAGESYFEVMYSYCYVYVLLLMSMLCSVYSLPTAILRLPWLRVFHAFSSVVRQMPWYTLQRRGTVRTLPNQWIVLSYVLFVSILLFYVLYCLCVNVYCTTATGCQPNCS
jgi:hypothetical protein